MEFVTAFGDPAVVLPVAAVVLIWLVAIGLPRMALFWASCVAACGVATILLRVILRIGRYAGIDDLLHVPSGHTSGSTLVYGAVTLVMAGAFRNAGARRMVVAAGGLWILAIGLSRIATEAHTTSEVLAGFAIGVGSLLVFRRAFHPPPGSLPGVSIVALCSLAIALLLHGERADLWTVVEAAVRAARGA